MVAIEHRMYHFLAHTKQKSNTPTRGSVYSAHNTDEVVGLESLVFNVQ